MASPKIIKDSMHLDGLFIKSQKVIATCLRRAGTNPGEGLNM